MANLQELYADVAALHDRVLKAEKLYADKLERVLPHHRQSAINLVHYLAVRSQDLRPLQDKLSDVGLSSLGRMEAGVLGHLERVLTALKALADEPVEDERDSTENVLTPAAGREILDKNAREVLGPPPETRVSRIMVTMPNEAATDQQLVSDLVMAGMDIARINCAHDDETAWAQMITHLHSDQQPVKPLIAMDLAGPKLRTGPIVEGPHVAKVRPSRSEAGKVEERSLVLLHSTDEKQHTFALEDDDYTSIPARSADGAETSLGSDLQIGDIFTYVDARGSKRNLRVEAVAENALLVSCNKTVYWETGGKLTAAEKQLIVGDLPPVEQSMRVYEGEDIILTRSMEPQPAVSEPPYRIGCSLEEAFDHVKVGERVWIDDGKIGTLIREVTSDEIRLEVVAAGANGSKMRAEKGINFPDSHIVLPALTEEDLTHIPFVAQHADMVNMSFVRTAEDVAQLLSELQEHGGTAVDVVLKIETVAAFQALPEMLLEAMRWEGVGVMIARGDLAVEAGWERLAELQEEILWLCEAAHVPVIWATQVLESLAKSGMPSRAEITDAAMSQRAEAVMLNKGPFIIEAVTALQDILARMDGHLNKKRDMLRQLQSWTIPELEI